MKKLLVGLIALFMVIGFYGGSSQAAVAALHDLPGGAMIFPYWSTHPNGEVTLISITNSGQVPRLDVEGPPYRVCVHIVLLDHNSQEIYDFNIWLSTGDVWNVSISDAGAAGVTLAASSSSPADDPVAGTYGAGRWPADTTKYGYMTAVLNSVNAIPGYLPGGAAGAPGTWWAAAAAGIANPPTLNNSWTAVNDWLLGFEYLVNVPGGYCSTMNATTIQGFENIPLINEVANFTVPFDWGGDASPPGPDFPQTFVGNDDAKGIWIDSWELYTTVGAGGAIGGELIVADADADGIPDVNTVLSIDCGSRWINSAATNSTTQLMLCYPASSADIFPAYAPYRNLIRVARFTIWNEDEGSTSATRNPEEVSMYTFASADPVWGIPVPAGAEGGWFQFVTTAAGGTKDPDFSLPVIGYVIQTAEANAYSSAFQLYSMDPFIVNQGLGAFGQVIAIINVSGTIFY